MWQIIKIIITRKYLVCVKKTPFTASIIFKIKKNIPTINPIFVKTNIILHNLYNIYLIVSTAPIITATILLNNPNKRFLKNSPIFKRKLCTNSPPTSLLLTQILKHSLIIHFYNSTVSEKYLTIPEKGTPKSFENFTIFS